MNTLGSSVPLSLLQMLSERKWTEKQRKRKKKMDGKNVKKSKRNRIKRMWKLNRRKRRSTQQERNLTKKQFFRKNMHFKADELDVEWWKVPFEYISENFAYLMWTMKNIRTAKHDLHKGKSLLFFPFLDGTSFVEREWVCFFHFPFFFFFLFSFAVFSSTSRTL